MLDAQTKNGDKASPLETLSRNDHTRELNALRPNAGYSRKRVLDIAAHYAHHVPFEESPDNAELSFALKEAAARFGLAEDEIISHAARMITLGPIGW